MNTSSKILLVILGIGLYIGINNFLSKSDQKNEGAEMPETETSSPEPKSDAISFPTEGGIIYISDIINENDESILKDISYQGRANRNLYDARSETRPATNVFLFKASYKDGMNTDFWVNPEFGNVASAKKEVEKYAKIVGQLPACLRKKTYYFGIHKGNENFEAQVSIVYVYTEMTKTWEADELLEEALIHETVHSAFFFDNETMDKWFESQQADDRFITEYAAENPDREDMAESFLFYFAAKYRGHRLEPSIRDSILIAIPNRTKFFDNLMLDMYPFE